jgi:hypothetical protein
MVHHHRQHLRVPVLQDDASLAHGFDIASCSFYHPQMTAT